MWLEGLVSIYHSAQWGTSSSKAIKQSKTSFDCSDIYVPSAVFSATSDCPFWSVFSPCAFFNCNKRFLFQHASSVSPRRLHIGNQMLTRTWVLCTNGFQVDISFGTNFQTLNNWKSWQCNNDCIAGFCFSNWKKICVVLVAHSVFLNLQDDRNAMSDTITVVKIHMLAKF